METEIKPCKIDSFKSHQNWVCHDLISISISELSLIIILPLYFHLNSTYDFKLFTFYLVYKLSLYKLTIKFRNKSIFFYLKISLIPYFIPKPYNNIFLLKKNPFIFVIFGFHPLMDFDFAFRSFSLFFTKEPPFRYCWQLRTACDFHSFLSFWACVRKTSFWPHIRKSSISMS